MSINTTSSSEQYNLALHTINKQRLDTHIYHSGLIKFPNIRGHCYIRSSSILYLKAESNYTHVYFTDGRSQLYSKTLKHLASYLPTIEFARIHHSYLINKSYITSWNRSSVTLSQDIVLPVSRRMYKHIVVQLFK